MEAQVSAFVLQVTATEETREIPAPAWVFGGVALLILLLLLVITLSFNRDR